MKKKISKTDLAWAAGFIDGEGSFFIGRTRQGKWRYFRVQLKVTQADIRPLKRLQQMFGGYVYPEKKIYSPLTKRPGWKWMAVDRVGANAVELMLPFFFLKRGQAKLLLNMAKRKQRQGKRNLQGNEFSERIALVVKMQKLNRGYS